MWTPARSLGIAGVSGNGQSELIQCLTGLLQPTSGEIVLRGENMAGRSVGDIRQARVCLHSGGPLSLGLCQAGHVDGDRHHGPSA